MALTFEAVEPAAATDPQLRADLLRTWVAVTDAGGSVGFTPPAQVDAVAEVLDAALARVAAGADALGVLRDGDGEGDGEGGGDEARGAAVGMGLLVDRDTDLCRHWRTVLRVMVHPHHQGRGAGLLLMRGLHELGSRLGLEQLQLTVRAGHGTEDFYSRLGYTVVGRHPRAVRVAPGDDRDEVMMVRDLDPAG